MVKSKIHIDELLKKGHTVQFKPNGSSMCPTFASCRDDAIVAPYICGNKLRRGDVVLYRRDNELCYGNRELFTPDILVLHRIWKCKNRRYYMVGDNQTFVEGPIREEQIIGIMTGMIRKGRMFTTKNLWYRLWSCCWLRLRPFRRVLLTTMMYIWKKAKR